ncbi:MAG: DUF4988 domain-containing protein [Paludibacteraceae bacterium]|nr:DUF4988 domain-containing protein [Paludibacteraceae bacterium]
MKKYIYGIMAMIAGAVAFIACEDDIDEVAQWNRVVDNSSDIAGLKSACDKINYNVSSFTKIVEAQNKNLFISAAYPNEDGFLIVFSDGSFAQLLNGKDGADGKDGINGTNGVDGKDGYVPAIAIKKDADGIYYWTCDGAFMLDETGNKVPAQGKDGANGINGTNGLVAQFMVSEAGELQYRYSDTDAWTSLGNVKGADGVNGADGINGSNGADGKTPTFKIVEGNLLVSYDGANWNDLGNVKGADGANGTNGTNGTDGINGTNGNDGITPEFKIEDGKWFVSYNNKATWVELGQATGDKGEKGDKGDAGLNGTNGTNGTDGINGTNGKDGITPKLKIVDGYWYISYDGGVTYETEPLGKATGDKGANGTNGVDGKTPTFKVEGGVLFVSYDETTWKSLGLVKGVSGEAGKTPTMKIEGGDWYVSYDDGETWANLGQATGDKGANGTNGTNGITPTFKVEGGNLYVSYNEGASWSNLGNVKGADGTNGTNGTNGAAGKDGVTPKLKITDGYWYISYDNEKTWTKLDKATGANGTNGTNGVDGKTPQFKIEGGALLVSYDSKTWTSLGIVKGADGKDGVNGTNGTNGTNGAAGKDGVTPKMKITDGYWYVSYDNGTTWTKLDKATGANGANGTNGTDGITPTFKVEGGNLYVSYNEGASWTNLGNVKGANGTNGTAGVTPKFKITDGYWYVSYDNGTTWTKLDKATGANGVDGKTPELSINSEGHLISTVNGVATDLGNVTGATPVIKVEDGKWKVSTDGGTTWNEIAGSSTVGGGTAGYTSLGAPVSGYIDGYAYVDLGLTSGKKWATANVGAINEADYGLYFWWGDVIGYEKNTGHDFSSANADTYGKTVAQLQSAGIIGTDKNLVAERDAATQQWSENWKMPTKADFDELISECRWIWVSYGTAKGYKVESKKAGNNNWIFLPAAGDRNGTSSVSGESSGDYWSSTVDESYSSKACTLGFSSGAKNTYIYGSRNIGQTIRPVVSE